MEKILNNLISNDQKEDYNQQTDTILSILEKLCRIDVFKNEFIGLLITYGENTFFNISSHIVKKFIINFISQNIEAFYKQNFLYKFIKIYCADENPGVYDNTLILIFNMFKNEKYKSFLEENKFIIELILYFDSMNKNSIILIRELDLIIKYLNIGKENSKEVLEFLQKISSNFFNYDILTQLTLMDLLEKEISNENTISFVIKEINIFQKLGEGDDIDNQILRKCMYSLSKLYAKKMLNDDKLLKNLIVISTQYYNENKSETFFIISVIQNLFYNNEIFTFLTNPENNSQFNFLENILEIITEIFYNHDPKLKTQVLEIISLIGNFQIPSLAQEQFLKKLITKLYVWDYNKQPNSENELFQFIIDKLYKDFKLHDYEEYELQFLDTLLSKIYILIF